MLSLDSVTGRGTALREALAERVLVFDGSYGIALTSAGLTAADYGGEPCEGCNRPRSLGGRAELEGVFDAL